MIYESRVYKTRDELESMDFNDAQLGYFNLHYGWELSDEQPLQRRC